jgi:hypothetical protein
MMHINEMKIKAITQVLQLTDEASVKEILKHLDDLTIKQTSLDQSRMEAIFNKAVDQYGHTLEKLA